MIGQVGVIARLQKIMVFVMNSSEIGHGDHQPFVVVLLKNQENATYLAQVGSLLF